MKITCTECGGVDSQPCDLCGGTGKVEIPGDDCPHLLTGSQTTEYCGDCGNHLVGGIWLPSPGQRITALVAKVEEVREKIEKIEERFAEKEELYRHALEHVVDCEDGCTACQRLARDTLNRTGT